MKYDIMMLGHVSKDIMIDFKGVETRLTGGAVVQSSMAAVNSDVSVQVITKISKTDIPLLEPLKETGVVWTASVSAETTSIKNVYFTEDKERRDVTLLSQADPFSLSDLTDDNPRIYHLAGLFGGEIPDTMILPLSQRAEVALDAQGVLRCIDSDGELVFKDWLRKKELLPSITYFKTDAAEAEILTGEKDREKAALILQSWGAREIMLTHNTEVLICSDGKIFRAPFTNSNFSGRTGRGDSTFAAYLARRGSFGIEDSLRYAAALCSIKMETPGPFSGTVNDVLNRIKIDMEK